MKIAVCFLYVLFNVIYLTPVTDQYFDARVWGGFNIITQFAFVAYLCYEMEKTHTGDEQLMFQYLKILSIINCIYIVACIFKDKYWVWHNTGIFAYVMGIGFAVFMIHCAIRKR